MTLSIYNVSFASLHPLEPWTQPLSCVHSQPPFHFFLDLPLKYNAIDELKKLQKCWASAMITDIKNLQIKKK